MSDAAPAVANRAGDIRQFLTFVLGEELYGVDILRVQELRCWEPVSRIPNVPSYEKGVVNLRGAIVPIIDLRERFQLGSGQVGPMTVVVVLQVHAGTAIKVMGVVVDAVSDVVDVERSSIQSAPHFGTKVSTEFISGLASVRNEMVMLLDVDRLLKLEGLEDAGESRNQ